MQTSRQDCASNRLYRGEIVDARLAIQTYIEALREERDVCARLDRELGGIPSGGEPDLEWNTWIASAEKALRMLNAHEREAEREFGRKLMDSSDSTLRHIGEAIVEGDYTTLAI